MLLEKFPKNKINVINCLFSIVEHFNQKYVFQPQRYEKEQKITNPNFLPLPHQVYNAVKHLFLALFFKTLHEHDSLVLNQCLRFLAVFANRGYLQQLPYAYRQSLYSKLLLPFLNSSAVI